MTIPLARTSEEAHLWMDLQPCACGAAAFTRNSVLLSGDDGSLLRRYGGPCDTCGTLRDFVFRVPSGLVPRGPDGAVAFGGPEPSELFDAGQWLWISEAYARLHPDDPSLIPAPERARARSDLAFALGALDEVIKFVPSGADRVPSSALWTDRGRAEFARGAGRFRLSALRAVRETYQQIIRRY